MPNATLLSGATKCWGYNSQGNIGTNQGVTAISGGNQTMCATSSNGFIKCWASSTSGMLLTESTTLEYWGNAGSEMGNNLRYMPLW